MHRQGVDRLTHKDITSGISVVIGSKIISYIKLKIIVKVFTELNILGINEPEPEVYSFRVYYSSAKTDLEKLNLLRRIRSQQDK